jgi:O-antigen/teichoic acid export membrane protein
MSRNLTGRTLESAAWLGGASVVRLGLRVISVAILARLLTPNEYGVMAGALVAMQFAGMLCTLGLAPTLIQRREVRPDHIATAFSTSMMVAILAGAGIWFLAPAIAEVMHIAELCWVLQVLALTTPFGAFNTLCEAILARNMRAKSVALRPLFSFTLATFIIAIPLAYSGFGYWSLVAAQAAEVVLGAVAFAFVTRTYLVWPGFSRRAFWQLWPISFGFLIHNPFEYLVSNADQFLIARLIGPQALGLYSRASFLVKNGSNLFGNVARIAMFPAMAQVQDQHARIQNAMLKALSLTALASLPISAFAIIFSPEIIDLMLGSQWTAATVPFGLLSATLYLRLSRRACYALFQALGRPYWMTIAQALNAMALIMAIWWVAPNGLEQICIAILIVMTLVSAGIFAQVSYVIGLTAWTIAGVHGRPLALSAAIVVLGTAVKMLLVDLSGPLRLLAGVLASMLLVLLVVRTRPNWVFDIYSVHVLRHLQSTAIFRKRTNVLYG